jgi:hypothetical protein
VDLQRSQHYTGASDQATTGSKSDDPPSLADGTTDRLLSHKSTVSLVAAITLAVVILRFTMPHG